VREPERVRHAALAVRRRGRVPDGLGVMAGPSFVSSRRRATDTAGNGRRPLLIMLLQLLLQTGVSARIRLGMLE
jgi:hypothetical protein